MSRKKAWNWETIHDHKTKWIEEAGYLPGTAGYQQVVLELKSRTVDPISSKEAAQKAQPNANSQAGRILQFLDEDGTSRTAQDIADETGIPVYDVRKRLPDLARIGCARATNRETMVRGGVLKWKST